MNKRTMFMIGVVSAALLTSAGAVNATPTKKYNLCRRHKG